MRRHAHTPPSDNQTSSSVSPRSDRETLSRLWPYLWQYKWRVMLALGFMVGAKVANVGVPLLLKDLIDRLAPHPTAAQVMLVVPTGLLIAYGLLRLSTSLFAELRELVFAKATEGAARSISLKVFSHLHALSLRFHLGRQTGGMTRDIERGTRAVHSLISYSLYSIIPTLIEVALVLSLLAIKFDVVFAWITLTALVLYVAFTVFVTQWRTQYRKVMNELDSKAHTRAIDSLLNYETVKYFNNESFEAARYDEALEKLRQAGLKSQQTLSLLNTGQQTIIAVGLIIMLWRATDGVVAGRRTVGDLVMVNAFMIQLYIPLNFLGVIYREIKQSLTDLDKMFTLMTRDREVADAPDAGEALRHAKTVQPDVMLLDNHLPGVHGIDALPQLLEACPNMKIVMLTVSEDANDLANALARGAAGYLLKTIEGDALAEAVIRVLTGESVVSPEMTSKLIAAYRNAVTQPGAEEGQAQPLPKPDLAEPEPVAQGDAALSRLSPREHDILREIARGASNKEIARTLSIAETTVKIHVQHILRKLNLTSRVQAAVYATTRGA